MVIPHTEIIVTKDGAEIVRKTVKPGDYVIGKDAECDVPVEAEQVAERHAQLTINYDHALVEDLGSDSGTFVNGQRVTESTRLWPNQKIKVGSATVELRRVKTDSSPGESLAPQTAAVRQMLPEEFLREKKYDIGGMVARGGMGAILDAQEATIERKVAMKVMLDNSSPEDLVRFVAEAKITGQLEHPNIVPVHELNVDENDQVFYTMKFVKGMTLRVLLEKLREGDGETIRKYPLGTWLTIFQKVCDALAFAHSKRVIHRDLKPDNIMVGDFGEVLVMDWGLAKVLEKLPTPNIQHPTSNDEATRSVVRTIDRGQAGSATMAGSIMGTPQYMAPEQARGEIENLDARSDIYALGAILYHILTLQPAFEGGSLDDILSQVRSGKFIPPSQRVREMKKRPGTPPRPAMPDAAATIEYIPGAPTPATTGTIPNTAKPTTVCPHLPGGLVPESLEAVVLKAMAPEKADRYQKVADLQRDLTAYQNGFATAAERASLMKQILLLIKRHKGVFTTAFAAWLIITALGVWFIISIRASESKATHNAEVAQQNAQEAQRNARIAADNEQKATQNANLAAANEQKAVAEKENTRHALAKSQLALAEAAFRESDGLAMQAALNEVPDDLRDSNWNYLLARSDTSSGLLRARGSSSLRSVAADPTQPGVFALAKNPNVVTLMDTTTGRTLWDVSVTFPDKTTSSPRIAFSSDGAHIAVGKDGSGGLLILDAKNGGKLLEWEAPATFSLEFSPDGKTLLQCLPFDELNLWDTATGKLVWANKSKGTVRAAFHPAGKWIAAFSNTEKLRLLNPQNGAVLKDLSSATTSGGNLNCLAVSPDGKYLGYGDENYKIRVLKPDSGRIIWEAVIPNMGFGGVAFTADSKYFVSLSNLSRGRQSLSVWGAWSGTLLDSLLGGSGTANDLTIHPFSSEIAIAGSVSKWWRLPVSPRELWTLPMNSGWHTDRIASWGADELLFYPDRESTVLAFVDGSEKPSPIWTSADNFDEVGVSRDGRVAVVGQNKGGGVVVLGRSGRKVEPAQQFQVEFSVKSWNFRVSPTGDRAVFWGWQGKGGMFAEIWAMDSGRKLAALDTDGIPSLNDVGWLGDGERIVALATAGKTRGMAGSQEEIVVFDAASGKRVQTLPSESALNCLAMAPDGASFAEAGADRIVRIRDARTLEVRQQFRAHDEAITALAFHPTQPILATGSEDLTVKLWDLNTARMIDEVRELRGGIMQLAFTGSGRRLACTTGDRLVHVWEPDSLKPEALANATAAKPDDAGWENLLAKLTRDEVGRNGNGWELNNGVLFSPNKEHAVVALPGNFAQASYQVRVQLRQLNPQNAFAVILPVANHSVGLLLEGFANLGYLTSLTTVNGQPTEKIPDAVKGKVIKDSEQHELELTVRLEGDNVRFESRLDDQPLYDWSGPARALARPGWQSPSPGDIGLCAWQSDWVVSAVKVKRLEAGK